MVIAYEFKRGARFRLCAVGTKTADKIHLPYYDFIREAQYSVPAEWPKLVRLLDYVAEAGPPHDENKSKPLKSCDGLFEFRTKGGLRLFWFYDEQRLVICANGYIKQSQKTPRRELTEAKRWRDLYLKAKRTQTLQHLAP